MIEPGFPYPIQTAATITEHYGMHRSTLSRAYQAGVLGDAAYLSGITILIDTTHPDFGRWLVTHLQQPRVKGSHPMQTFLAQIPRQRAFTFSGSTFVEALGRNFPQIVREAAIGDEMGYTLVQVTARYKPEILEGKGGAELLIHWKRGATAAPFTTDDQVNTTTLWIEVHAAALPRTMRPPFLQPMFFPISKRKKEQYPVYRLASSTFIVFHVLPRIMKAGLAGSDISTERAVHEALLDCEMHYPTALPHELDRDLALLVRAADKRIAEYFVGGFVTEFHNAVVRRRMDRDDLPVDQRAKVSVRNVVWGNVLQAHGRSVEVAWQDGTTSWEPFWSLQNQILSERTDSDLLHQRATLL